MPYHQNPPPDSLGRLLSSERMGTFSGLAGDASPLSLYTLDVELSSAFMADIALAEVILRNAMNHQLTNYLGERWYERRDVFDNRSRTAIQRAWKNGKCADNTSSGKLIAELMLGFWVELLDAGGIAGPAPHNEKLSYDMVLWRPCLRLAFPHGTQQRAKQHSLAKRVLALRNRIAHHEPVIGGVPLPGTRERRSLPHIHRDILDLVGTVQPDISSWMTNNSRVPDLLAVLHKRFSPRAEGI